MRPFLSLKAPAHGEITIKRSRFLCDLEPVRTPEEAEAFLESVRKRHRDATHNCSAVVIGDDAQFVKCSDDGEPQGTAGIPMLDVLKKSRVRNLIAVVTRYFGGVLLGAGGLVRAYSASVSGTLANADIVQNVPGKVYGFTVPYADYGKLQSIASGLDARVEAEFGRDVDVVVTLREDRAKAFLERMSQALLGALDVELDEDCLLEEKSQP